MKLKFPENKIRHFAAMFDEDASRRDQTLTNKMTQNVFPAYLKRGWLTKKEFLTVCEWKSPRPRRHFESNDESFIREVSALSLTASSEQLRIQSWTLLAGVKWPTASVFLHFAFQDLYPIMDVRALWSLGQKVPSQYTFPFWMRYVECCREIAKRAKVSMRDLDKALWKYSALQQRAK